MTIHKIASVLWLIPGFVLWASFPPMCEMADVAFALSPLLWYARKHDVRASAKCWFLNGLVFWGATLSWFPAIVKNGGPWPLVVLGWAGLAAYCSIFFAAFGGLSSFAWQWVKNRGYGYRLLMLLFVEPILWAGLEIVRSRFLGGFAWNQLGVVAVNSGFGAPAALGGVYLLSAIVILVNGTFASIAERMFKPDISSVNRRLRSIETILPVLLVLAIYKVSEIEPADRGETLRVAMLQRNMSCVFNRGEESPKQIYSRLLGSAKATSPDLVVLPESAMCEFGSVDGFNAQTFARKIMEITGAKEVIAGGGRNSDGKAYNSAALYSKDALDIYDKVHLVPFGEFIPGDKLITALQKLAPVGSCTPGELKTLGRYGVAICFEDTDSAQIRKLAALGAKALVFITNDSWFSHSEEAMQHAWQSVARAIETGLPVIRVGNSGVTGTISRHGVTTWLADDSGKPLVDGSGTMSDAVSLPAGTGPTPYVVAGDLPIFFAFILVITALSLIKYQYEDRKRRILSMQVR